MGTEFYADPGSLLNQRYMVQDIIGTGSTAIVLVCLDTKTRDKKAVKRFFKEKLTKTLEERIYSEPELNIRSNYVVKAEEYFFDGYLNLAMPYIEGQTLRDILEIRNCLDKPHALYTSLCLAQAASDLEAVRIASTDIKPENVIITPDGVAKLIDITCFEMINSPPELSQGTEGYAGPELLEQRCLTPYTDIYSIGIVLCEMLVGTEELMKMSGLWELSIKRGIMPDISFIERRHPDIAGIVRKSINPDPNSRYKTANELSSELLSAYNLITGFISPKEKRLILVCSDGRELSIKKGTVILGRNDFNNVYISEKHFEIDFDGDSLVRIKDKGSTNGTTLNNRKISRRWKKLYDTDVIQVADIQMKVRL